jgi:MFS family permease
MPTFGNLHAGVESPFAWLRLIAAVALGTIGSVGMWSVPVVLPAVQVEFGVARADASLPFTLAMIGFACGGVLMGRLTDRFGIAAPVICGALALSFGYVAAGFAPSLMLFAVVHILIGLGSSATFGPLIADTSQWFTRRRGIAVAICFQRQLSRGRDLAAGRAAFRGNRRLAGHAYGHWRLLRACHAAVFAGAAAARADAWR